MNIEVTSEEIRIQLLRNIVYNLRMTLNNIEILNEEIYLNKRLISEMIHIKKQYYDLNLQHDTDFLDPIY